MDHRPLQYSDNPPDHARLALQPREVKFCDLAPLLGHRPVDSPSKNERRGFRPTPQKSHTHAMKSGKPAVADGFEAESGEEEERRGRGGLRDTGGREIREGRRGLAEGGGLGLGLGLGGMGLGGGVTTGGAGHHLLRSHRVKTVKASKATQPQQQQQQHTEQLIKHMEISGNAVRVEDYGVSAVNALAVLGNCVKRERRLKEELARIHAGKMLAFRGVINFYLDSVKQCRKPIIGRRKATSEFALAQCAVIAQTLILTIQSYIRAFQSRKHTANIRYIRRSEFHPDTWSSSSVGMPQFNQLSNSEGSFLSETTSSLHDLLDEEEISRLKQLYFDYYDCDVYVIPGTRPESGIPPNALLLNSLSAHDPFLPDDENMVENSSLSTSSASI